MRLSVLAAAPLFVASTTLARSPLKRGVNTDTCSNLNHELVFPDFMVDGKPYDAGLIDVGLCASQVKNFIGHFSVTEAAAKVVGTDKVEAALLDMIEKAGTQCSYPLHAKPSVTETNECDFICTDGFQAMPQNHPTSCICPAYMTECDGQCSKLLQCPSSPPPSRRANEPTCAEGLTMCGASGQGYQCVDITSNPSMCGGCLKPSPFGPSPTNGINCNTLPNVGDVDCVNSRCVIQTCKNGLTPSGSYDQDACVDKSLHSNNLL